MINMTVQINTHSNRHTLDLDIFVGDSHKGPLMNRENPLFRKITKHKQTHKPQITPRVVAAQSGEGPTTQIISTAHQAASRNTPRANFRLARGPGAAPRISTSLGGYAPPRVNLRLTRGLRTPSGEYPPRSRATHSLGRVSARAKLRLARGLRAPSGESPPRSSALRVRNPRTHSPDRSIKCSDTPRAPGSKANPRQADPLTPPGNRIPALFRQPSP
jgi:hypothetical protein